MNIKLLSILALLLGFFVTDNARALDILDFGRMNDDDDATFVAAMVQGASDYMKANGHPDQAEKVINLFHDPSQSGGVYQFAMNMKTLYNINNRNATNPNNRTAPFQVEDAMARTLSDNGINIPVATLISFNKNFRPMGPRRGHPSGQ